MAAERPGPDASWVRVRVRIDGDELTIRGKGPESYVIELADMVNSRIQEAYRLRQENRELTQILEEVR